jgi:hypothetical protein
MPDDWVSKYMIDSNQRQKVRQKCCELALAGASGLFRQVADRVKQDVESFHRNGGYHGLTFHPIASSAFKVAKREFPSATLEVRLEQLFLNYQYHFKSDHISAATEASGALRISSDVEGRIQVIHEGEPITEISEISEVLLTPLFKFAEAK